MSSFRHPASPRPGPPLRNTATGFTLVEVLAAAFVLVVAILSSLGVIQMGFRTTDMSRGITLASQVVQSELERARMMGSNTIDSIAKAQVTSKTPDDVTPSGIKIRDFKAFRSVSQCKDAAGKDIPGMWEIVITASWKTVDGITQSRRTSTRYCRNGLYDYFATDPSL